LSTAKNLLSPRQLCHFRFNHIGDFKIEFAVRNCTAIGLNVDFEEFLKDKPQMCIWCFIGKFHKFPAPKSLHLSELDKSTAFVMDYKSFKTRSLYGNKYFNLILHLKTTMLFVDVEKTKNQIVDQILTIEERILQKYNLKIKTLQSDSDVIYQDRKIANWASKNGINLQYTAPYRHEGTIERWMRTVLDMLRTIMQHGEIAEKYWEIVLIFGVVVTLNSMPNSIFPKSCPLTELNGKLPDISHFRPLGFPAVVMVYDDEKKNKSMKQPYGIEVKILGFSQDVKNAYIVLTKSGSVLVRKDVVVDENWGCKSSKHVDVFEENVVFLEDEKELSEQKLTKDADVLPAVKEVVKSQRKNK